MADIQAVSDDTFENEVLQAATPVLIALTGYGREEDKDQAVSAGFDHHLVKPVEPSALEGLVAQLGKRTDGTGSVLH